MLLDHGSNVEALGRSNEAAIHGAANHEHNEVVGLLLDYGAHIDALDPLQNTALHIAATTENKELLSLLLRRGGANPDIFNQNE